MFCPKCSQQQISDLPPAYGKPADDYFTGRINTAELVPPPSVTEDTTNLLSHNLNK